jgi:hypothetical protein
MLVGIEDVAVGNASANWKGRINQRVDLDGLEILANKCQASVRTEVVGQLFDNEVGHVCSHLQGELHFKPKPLIYIGNSGAFYCEVTDSGLWQQIPRQFQVIT